MGKYEETIKRVAQLHADVLITSNEWDREWTEEEKERLYSLSEKVFHHFLLEGVDQEAAADLRERIEENPEDFLVQALITMLQQPAPRASDTNPKVALQNLIDSAPLCEDGTPNPAYRDPGSSAPVDQELN